MGTPYARFPQCPHQQLQQMGVGTHPFHLLSKYSLSPALSQALGTQPVREQYLFPAGHPVNASVWG